MTTNNNSLMVVLDDHEYCFLYDQPSFPSLLSTLLGETSSGAGSTIGFNREQAHEITRGLIGKAHQDL